jgi:hypothetical protein
MIQGRPKYKYPEQVPIPPQAIFLNADFLNKVDYFYF